METTVSNNKTTNFSSTLRVLGTRIAILASMFAVMLSTAFADPTPAPNSNKFGEDVTIKIDANASADDLMGRIIGILLSISRWVGVALLIYGIYEVVMSFMQNQPEAKTKGIIMALAGIVMIGLKSVLKGIIF